MRPKPKPRLRRRLLRPREVMARMGWSRTTLWRRVRAGKFPAPVETGVNSTGFFEDEVDAAQAELPRVQYAPAESWLRFWAHFSPHEIPRRARFPCGAVSFTRSSKGVFSVVGGGNYTFLLVEHCEEGVAHGVTFLVLIFGVVGDVHVVNFFGRG